MTEYESWRNTPTFPIAAGRALIGRCPNCGSGKLFASYLKLVDRCEICSEKYGHVHSDDAAPWLTILVVGHIAVPIALAAETHAAWPIWISMCVWPALALVLGLAVLPRAKGFLVAAIWLTGAPGSERE